MENRGKKPPKQKFSIYFDIEQWEVLRQESERTGVPIAEMVRRVVRGFYPTTGDIKE